MEVQLLWSVDVVEGPLILGISMGGLTKVVISQLSLKSEYDWKSWEKKVNKNKEAYTKETIKLVLKG